MRNCYLTILSVFLTTAIFAQERVKKIEFYGGARTNILFQDLADDSDTLNVQKANYGHSLIDLGILIRPSNDTEIITELRMRNELGGFYGSAVTFGLRRLTLKGVINDAIRYKIGDIDFKLTPYTLYNNTYQDHINEANVFRIAREVIDYENFFGDNTWRRQGMETEFGIDLRNDNFKSIDFRLFSTRSNPANPGVNMPERFYTGGTLLLQTSYGKLAFNSANLHDLKNTVNDNQLYYNYVNTVSASVPLTFVKDVNFDVESGWSSEIFEDVIQESTQDYNDYFWNAGLSYTRNESQYVRLNSMYTGPFFRSHGAQNVRVDYQSESGIFPVITNNQLSREIGLLDYLYNDVAYRKTFDNKMDISNPSFSSALPYGLATPNRTGLAISAKETIWKDRINLATDIYSLKEILGSGTEALKSFLKVSAMLDANYNKWQIKSGITFEQTNRDGLSYEQIDLSSFLVDFGIDFKLTDNISLMYGGKLHMSDGNDLTPLYDDQNQIFYFENYEVDGQSQTLNALGINVDFSEKSKLTISYNSFVQYHETKYTVNQFHVLYRLNL